MYNRTSMRTFSDTFWGFFNVYRVDSGTFSVENNLSSVQSLGVTISNYYKEVYKEYYRG
jgi:hypothetical protein